jgi:hypothetical protein
VELPRAVSVQREQQERGRDAVADAGLDGDSRLELPQELVEPQPFVVPLAAGDAAGVVAVPSLRLALNRVPEDGGLLLEVLDQPARADLVLSRAERYFFGRPSSTPVGR